MKETVLIKKTPGKKIINPVLTKIPKSTSSEEHFSITYEEIPVLYINCVVSFNFKNVNYIGVVSQPWFQGAYGIPTFTCSVYAEDGKIKIAPRSFRFPNVDIIRINDEDDIISLNKLLSLAGMRYYNGIKKVDYYTPIVKIPESYWTVASKEGVLSVINVPVRTKSDEAKFLSKYCDFNSAYLTEEEAQEKLQIAYQQFEI